jgi:hypothetical protein
MMRLTIAPEPASFADKVREPGENVLALLADLPLPHRRHGRPIELWKQIGDKPVRKTIEDFPYWQNCLEELHAAYDGICAYYGFYIERATLPHTEHFVAKSAAAQALAYEWSNYRLACGHANTRKRRFADLLDPAEIEDGWFQLDLVTLEVRADPSLPDELQARVARTIERLELHKGRALEVRQRVMRQFRSGAVQLEFLAQNHPYLARELARQGIRSREQLPRLPGVVVDSLEPEL